MEISEHYLSFVVNRIQTLEMKLKTQTLSQLEKEFIQGKIAYLKKLTDLPLLIAINSMSGEELETIKNKYEKKNGNAKSFLLQLFGLEKLDTYIRQPKHVTLEYIKEAFLNDFDTMTTLLELQSRNFEYESRKQALYGVGLDGSISYLQLTHDEKNLQRHETQIENAISDASQNYNLETIKELRSYQMDRTKPLSIEFMLKHKDKVEQTPEMKKLAKRLTRKGILGKIDRILPFRKKREQKYLEAVLNSYENSHSLSALGITNQNITTMNEHQIRSLMKRIKKQSNYHRNKINEAKNSIKTAKAYILSQVKEYERLQAQDKEKFLKILSSKISYFPKMFQEQIWNEPNLKESLICFACYQEEKKLIEQLKLPNTNKAELLIQISPEQPKTYVKQVA